MLYSQELLYSIGGDGRRMKENVGVTEKVSVVIPCYNSEKSIKAVVDNVLDILEKSYQCQIILVNDYSKDNVWSVITEICACHENVIGLSLARNFGQQSARMAALGHVTGEYVVFMDDDGQHKAQDILRMIDKLKTGYDIVYAYFRHKKESGFRVWGSNINRKMTDWVMGTPKDVHTSSFFVTRRFVVDKLRDYTNPSPYTFGYFMQITKNIADIEVEHHERIYGKSGYTITKLLRLWMEGFTGFSVVPLRIASIVGVGMAVLGFIWGIYTIIHKLLNPAVAAGYTSLIAVMLFCCGMIMIMLGLLGEYVGRIFMNLNHLPQYVVKERLNVESDMEDK